MVNQLEMQKNTVSLASPLVIGQPNINGERGAEKTINHVLRELLQRWQNYTNIAPFIGSVNRYPLLVVRGSEKRSWENHD